MHAVVVQWCWEGEGFSPYHLLRMLHGWHVVPIRGIVSFLTLLPEIVVIPIGKF